MPRFVILEHDQPELHWDLMLDVCDVLQTWRLGRPPIATFSAIEATALADHRRLYLDYEGPVSGKRGSVKRWDVGDFKEEAESTPTRRVICFHGRKIVGRVVLEQIEGTIWRWLWQIPDAIAP